MVDELVPSFDAKNEVEASLAAQQLCQINRCCDSTGVDKPIGELSFDAIVAYDCAR